MHLTPSNNRRATSGEANGGSQAHEYLPLPVLRSKFGASNKR
jgi:hypothetical protein